MKKLCLVVLDGWGQNPARDGNAIAIAGAPNINRLAEEYPSTVITASGLSVGLPSGQMGNSEVGHLTMGAGRVVFQDLTRIGKSIDEGAFFREPELLDLFDSVRRSSGVLHLMGLLSDGGVHSHIDHLFAILKAAKNNGIAKVFVHAFLDGRDTSPSSGLGYMSRLVDFMRDNSIGAVASVIGRFYAMDRDNRWDRVSLAFDAICAGAGLESSDPVEAIRAAYERGETDEFVRPVVIMKDKKPVGRVQDKDSVFFFNFRADRAREITRAFIQDDFDGFERRSRPGLSRFLTMTEYDRKFEGARTIFKPQSMTNILGEVISKLGLGQFRVSETEKYAHVTFFFNGGVEEPFAGEKRLLIPSIKDVPTYDLAPEMRAREIADAAIERIEAGSDAFVLMNIANGDMVGHTGKMDAAFRAVRAVDDEVKRIVDSALAHGYCAVITSDHGNVEEMKGNDGSVNTAHSTNPVPFIVVDEELRGKGAVLAKDGGLEDVAPTVLKIMGIEKPQEMTGKSIV